MRRYALLVQLTLIVWSSAASAQLSGEDVAALQARGKAEGWTFTVGKNPATERPMDELCGLVVPKDWRKGARFTDFSEKADLPASFDWRAFGGCVPVRDQGGCGSCWAFGTVGPLECNILIKDGTEVDLSEQWLVSCNQETEPPVVMMSGEWGCDGGWWAHEYHQGAKTDPCDDWGAVLESDFPYSATDAPCDCPYPHTYEIDSWAFIGPELEVADVEDIKQAIVTYGPISTAVCVDITFGSYTSGVFNAGVQGEPNHAVVLVGWDDNQGAEGVWFLRNSWSAHWGELGYMRIEYGRSQVGFGACYVDYPGQGGGAGPVITTQPAGGDAIQGRSYQLTVEASGMGLLRYEWERNGELVGTDSPSYVIEAASPEDEGEYVCVVSDMRGTSFSSAAMLNVIPAENMPVSGAVALCLLSSACVAASLLRIRKMR